LSTLSTLIQHGLGIPSQSNKTGRRNKGIHIGKEKVKLSLFSNPVRSWWLTPVILATQEAV
jgi:hypothetical protein